MIVFLQKIFGEDRKYLILVDEISKANDDVKVMRDLGEILNKIDNCDIVVSSLSPQYINKLLTGSQRNINYVILPPLLYSNLGKEECKYFYKKILQCAESKNIILNNVDEFKKNLIENAYLLCSGHPRTIEGLVNYMNNIDDLNIDKFISFIKSKRLQLSNMVFEYCNTLINNEERISIGSSSLIDYYDEYPSKLSKILFSHPTERSSRNEQFRYELDNNLVMIFKKVSPKSFLASVQAIKLLDFISEDESFEYKNEVEDDKLLSNGLILLNEIKKKNVQDKNNKYTVVSTWWKRFVDLTILGRSYRTCSIFDCFGIQNDKLTSSILSKKNIWEISVVNVKNLKSTFATVFNNTINNTLIIPIENQKGFDSCVVLHLADDDTKLIFYSQMKIGKTSKLRLKIVANTVFQTIKTHIEVNKEIKNDVLNSDIDFENVHIVYYDWGADDASLKITKEDLLKEVEKKNISNDDRIYLENTKKYIGIYFTNIHFVDYFQLKEWLNPTFLPFPILLTNIGVNNNENNDD